jgi:hypothetical protein
MGKIDDSAIWILHLFKMEEAEGRGEVCKRYPLGTFLPDLPLAQGELVYGIYKKKYFFTPLSLIIKDSDGIRRIEWKMIRHCTSKHGEGSKTATLSLIDGTKTKVAVSDFATSWTGRISQLFHQMVERWGSVSKDEYVYSGPPHLDQYAVPLTEDEIRAIGLKPGLRLWVNHLQCSCKTMPSHFHIQFQGELLHDGSISDTDELLQKIKLSCESCSIQFLLFDPQLHGYDAFIGENYMEKHKGKDIYNSYNCSCGGNSFSVIAVADYAINSDDLADFPKAEWGNSFDWFTAYFQCANCQKAINAIDYECA